MLTNFLKKNKKLLLAIFTILIAYILYTCFYNNIVEGAESMDNTTDNTTTKSSCDDKKCREQCPELDIECLKEHAEVCGDCTFNVSEISEQIEQKTFNNTMNIPQPQQKPVNITIMNQNDPQQNNDEEYMLGILPNGGPSRINDYNDKIIFSGPKKKDYVLINPTTGEINFPKTLSTTGMFTQTGYYPSNTGNQSDASEYAAPNVDQFKQPRMEQQQQPRMEQPSHNEFTRMEQQPRMEQQQPRMEQQQPRMEQQPEGGKQNNKEMFSNNKKFKF